MTLDEWVYSPSQIASFRQCPRRWAWEKLHGIEVAPHPSAELGTRVHKQLENWLRSGEPFDLSTKEGEIAISGLAYLPPPGTVHVELPLQIRIAGFHVRGFMDAYAHGLVIDHKTTADFAYAKTPEELLRDPQGVVYGTYALQYAPEAELRWIYYRTRGSRQARKVSLRVVQDSLAEGLEGVIRDLRAMDHIRTSGQYNHAKDLPPSVESCDAYGGCKHIDRCQLTAKERFIAMSSREAFLASLPAAGRINPPAPVAPAAPPPAGPVSYSEDGRFYWVGNGPWLPVPEQPAPPLPPALPAPPLPPALPAPPLPPQAPPGFPAPPQAAPEAKRGPGRPKGSRNKAEGAAAEALADEAWTPEMVTRAVTALEAIAAKLG